MSDKNKKSKFINPLLRSTLPKEEGQEKAQRAEQKEEGNISEVNNISTLFPTLPSDPPIETIKSFESKHERFTTWIDKSIKKQFDKLAKKHGKGSKTRLMNEALSDLLKKYES